jgi:hypothetical protein
VIPRRVEAWFYAVNPPEFFTTTPLPPEDKLGLAWLFSIAFLLFLAIYLYEAITLRDNDSWTRVKEAFGVVLPALTGTLGTVIGFYFGNRNKTS